jgi:Zn-finger nucleic acid-binding protein
MAFRDNTPPAGICLRCKRGLAWIDVVGNRFARCATCGTAQLSMPTFDRMWTRIVPRAKHVPLILQEGGNRPCPVCRKPMSGARVERVLLDVCEVHGIWFDPIELEAALASGMLDRGSWLALFRDHLQELA